MIYYIDIVRREQNNAALKAPEDISKICRQLGLECFPMPAFPSQRNRFFQRAWLFTVGNFYWIKLNRALEEGDIVVYQHPMYGIRNATYFIPRMQKNKKCKFIAVVHDLRTLRKEIAGAFVYNQKTSELSDNVLLRNFDAIICHNQHMKEYLISREFIPDRLVTLDIFDYLEDCDQKQHTKAERPSIAIAGNLIAGKCAYIYNIINESKGWNLGLTIHLYGDHYKESLAQGSMIYHGSFSPEELPGLLEGDFGLVWDGPSAETCEGNIGEYLKYNNPHKTSLYLASGMPVVVWDQAAIADFVLENGVGIAADSLEKLEKIISDLSEDDYRTMCKNVQKIGEKIRSGYYFSTALSEALEIVKAG